MKDEMHYLILTLVLVYVAMVTAELQVQQNPKWPTDVTLGNGRNLQFRCSITSKPDIFNVTWTKDNTTITNKRFSVDTDRSGSTLFKQEVSKEDQGTYACIAKNEIGEVAKTSVFLDVNAPTKTGPKINAELSTLVDGVSLGDNANLTCVIDPGDDVSAQISLDYGWYRDGVPVNDTAKHAWDPQQVGDYTYLGLHITDVTEEDLGNYTCWAKNLYGADNQTMNLKRSEPQPVSTWIIIVASVGGVVVLATVVVIATCARMRKKEPGWEDLPWMNTDNYEATGPPEYDVFISYSAYDRTWVKDILMKNLENEGYKVCIDFKSFMPGMQVVDNIMEAIYKSRRTVVVMSKHFLTSVWGAFELEHVQHRLITMKDDSLLLVKYDDCQMPRKLMGRTFLDWSDKSVKPHFWERLFKTLGPERVQRKEDAHSLLGMDIGRLTDFEAALLETERLRAEHSIQYLGDEAPLLEDSGSSCPSEEDSLLQGSGSSGFASYGSPAGSQTSENAPGDIV